MAAPGRTAVTGKKVQLMATCLCDAFHDGVARATVEVLEYLGCEVVFPEGQTCCGQPAFNAGDWPSSRKVVRHTASVFAGDVPIVIPSGSCAAMMFHGAVLEFEKESDLPVVQAVAKRTWELGDFIVNGMGITSWPGRFNARVALHRSCHTRGTASSDAVAQLVGSVAGVTLVPFGEGEQCCGFGGTFSVGFPNISAAMGELKLDNVRAARPDILLSGDMGCLMHLNGLAARDTDPVRSMHFSEFLRDALANA